LDVAAYVRPFFLNGNGDNAGHLGKDFSPLGIVGVFGGCDGFKVTVT
jgi:hypothetical protein